jgi:hypothetical protein
MHLEFVTTSYEVGRNMMARLISRRLLVVAALCVAVSGFGIQAASADVLLSEDFESYGGFNLFPAVPPWELPTVGEGNFFEPADFAQSTLSAGSQGLYVADNDTNGTFPRGKMEFGPVSTGASAPYNLRLTFDVNMVDPDNLNNYLVRLADTGDANNQIGPAMLLDRSDGANPPDGAAGAVWVFDGPSNANRFIIGVNDGTSSTDHGTALSTDEWHRIVVDVFMADFQYQVTIDGGTPSPLLNWIGQPAVLNRVRLADNNPSGVGGEIYFDNFLVESVPFPEGVPGDYNGDLVVNAADYTSWRNNLGGPDDALLNRNPENSGPINSDDYDFWKANYGNTAGSGTSAGSILVGAVPEPATLLMAVSACIAMSIMRRRSTTSAHSDCRPYRWQ